MAEGWTRKLKGDLIDAYSAGIETHGLNPFAVEVMAEAGVDISAHTSKHVETVKDMDFDMVITVCDNARETCPFFPGAKKVIHVSFSDPPSMAEKLADQEAQRNCYRQVRDQIRAFVETLPQSLMDS